MQEHELISELLKYHLISLTDQETTVCREISAELFWKFIGKKKKSLTHLGLEENVFLLSKKNAQTKQISNAGSGHLCGGHQLENSFAEKDLRVLVDTKVPRRQQHALAAKKVKAENPSPPPVTGEATPAALCPVQCKTDMDLLESPKKGHRSVSGTRASLI